MLEAVWGVKGKAAHAMRLLARQQQQQQSLCAYSRFSGNSQLSLTAMGSFCAEQAASQLVKHAAEAQASAAMGVARLSAPYCAGCNPAPSLRTRTAQPATSTARARPACGPWSGCGAARPTQPQRQVRCQAWHSAATCMPFANPVLLDQLPQKQKQRIAGMTAARFERAPTEVDQHLKLAP